MTRSLWIALLLPALAGCCSWAAGHCPKPPVLPPQVVTVEKRCELPVLPELPEVVPVPVGDACPLPMVCFDTQGAARLAVRESRMKTWIKEAKAACGAATQPTK